MKESEPFQKVRDFMREAYEEEFEHTGGRDTLLTSLPIDTFIIHKNETIAFEYPSIEARNENMAQLYLMADMTAKDEPYQTLEAIAALHGNLTRERVRQINKTQLKKTYDNSSPHLQDKYPFDELTVTRPSTVSMSRRRSLKRGTPIIEIEEDLKKGLTTQDLIAKHGTQKVAAVRQRLEKWNMKAPKRVNRDIKSIIEKLTAPETPDEDLKDLMSQLNNARNIRGMYKDVFVPLTDIQKGAWNNQDMRNTSLAYKLLEDAGIPTCSLESYINGKKVYYRLTLARKKEEAIEVLRKAPLHIKRDSVKKVGGQAVDEKVPTTTDFTKQNNGIKNDGYLSLAMFLDKEGIRIESRELKRLFTSEFFQNSPIPVYVAGESDTRSTRFYINKNNAAEFKKFIVDSLSQKEGVRIEEKKAFNFKMYTISQGSDH